MISGPLNQIVRSRTALILLVMLAGTEGGRLKGLEWCLLLPSTLSLPPAVGDSNPWKDSVGNSLKNTLLVSAPLLSPLALQIAKQIHKGTKQDYTPTAYGCSLKQKVLPTWKPQWGSEECCFSPPVQSVHSCTSNEGITAGRVSCGTSAVLYLIGSSAALQR